VQKYTTTLTAEQKPPTWQARESSNIFSLFLLFHRSSVCLTVTDSVTMLMKTRNDTRIRDCIVHRLLFHRRHQELEEYWSALAILTAESGFQGRNIVLSAALPGSSAIASSHAPC
jgi:hypothetical protein